MLFLMEEKNGPNYHMVLLLQRPDSIRTNTNRNYNLEHPLDNASLINSFLNTLPVAFFGIELMNDTRLIFLYGATCMKVLVKFEQNLDDLCFHLF